MRCSSISLATHGSSSSFSLPSIASCECSSSELAPCLRLSLPTPCFILAINMFKLKCYIPLIFSDTIKWNIWGNKSSLPVNQISVRCSSISLATHGSSSSFSLPSIASCECSSSELAPCLRLSLPTPCFILAINMFKLKCYIPLIFSDTIKWNIWGNKSSLPVNQISVRCSSISLATHGSSSSFSLPSIASCECSSSRSSGSLSESS